MHDRNLGSLRAREHATEAVQEAKTSSKSATKVELCKFYYAELCGIMRNYAELCGIMHLVVGLCIFHNRLSPDNEDN